MTGPGAPPRTGKSPIWRTGTTPGRDYPAPEIGDLDGDHRPDLLVMYPKGVIGVDVLRGEGGGRYGAPFLPAMCRSPSRWVSGSGA